MRSSLLTRSALVLVALAAAACSDDRSVTTPTPPPDPGAPKPPAVIGVYDITITGIGTDNVTASVTPTRPATPDGISASLTPITSGLVLEAVGSGSFSDGTRAGGGQRYLYSTFRVRNNTGVPQNNVTFLMASTASAISGTPVSVLRKFDNTSANSAIASQIAPTGVVTLGPDLVTMLSPYPDVLQVLTEAEVAAITPPAGVTNIFPYGFTVRNQTTTTTRTLPATTDANQFDGVFTVAFRVPLQPTAAEDVFTLSFQSVAVSDTETRLTESIEESQDTGAVRRLRDRATSLGATTVTVLNGSSVMDPAVPDYPGQRQICSPRTAGTAASPTNTIVTPAGYAKLLLLMPGEVLNTCNAYFLGGTPSRPATNVPFAVTVKSLDRYGNVKSAIDSVRLDDISGPPYTTPAGLSALIGGSTSINVTFSDYGTSLMAAIGKRLTGSRPIPVAGVVRTWTAGAGTTDWHTNNNWSPAAVPMSLDSVYIPVAAPLDPALAANVQVAGVTVEDVATIALGAFNLTATGSVFTGTSGGITNTSGTLFLAGVAQQVQGRVPRLRVTGTYSLSGNLTARAPIQADAGRLTASAFRLQADAN